MNETWHIPRASLAGSSASSSSNSSNKSYSVPSTVTRHSRHHIHHQQQHHQEGHLNLAYIEDNERINNHNIRHQKNNGKNLNHSSTNTNLNQNQNNCEIFSISSKSSGNKLLSRNLNKNHLHINNKNNNGSSSSDNDKNNVLKRGSRSSQGSTDSNNSTHSASSGSLLLTAANLERFAAIHKKQQKLNEISENRQNYNANITISQQQQQQQHQQDQLKSQQTTTTSTTNDTCIEIDPNLHFVKTKDVDAVSIASSTHFTMVNGVGGPPRKVKEGLCSRGHQVTVLIVSMSFFFLIGISAMVYLLEMRAREMPMN